VFTPLLASTAVGTLEPRTAVESARAVPGTEYWEAAVNAIDFDKKELQCISALQEWDHEKAFSVKYDKVHECV
jgi:NADH dehydrogenase FAD-containing subunit